ncbi:MAG: TetR family transcriptional regulator, partial [Nonomuraea sp.]|nr:TetR family transcriptional regulator [Nonomuraea sp.]
AATPPQAPPIEAVGAALDAVGEVFAGRRERSRVRQSVIRSHAELRERELIKLARLSDALAAAFGARGMGEPAASLTAEAIIAVFRVGFVRWVETEDDSELGDHLRESLAELREVTRECR